MLKDSKFGYYFSVSVGHLMTEFSGNRYKRLSGVAVLKVSGEGVELLCLPDEEVIVLLGVNYRAVFHITVERLLTVRKCGGKVAFDVSCATFELRWHTDNGNF